MKKSERKEDKRRQKKKIGSFNKQVELEGNILFKTRT